MVHQSYGPYEKYWKRPLDILCGILVLLLFWWLYLIVALLVRIKLGAPVLFRQERPGRDGKLFRLYKFRSMSDKRDADGNLLPDDERLTRFGRVLRSTSMDELPEVFNILNGDMSIVGPRPLLPEYLPYYTEEEMHRHDVRPGLTGYAQVNGRNATNWDERLQQDLYYVSHCSFALDCKILLQTVQKVVKRSDVLVGKQIPAGRLDAARSGKMPKPQPEAGPQVSIRPFTEQDIPDKVRWINDSANNRYLHYDLPLTEEKTREWFARNRDSKNRYDAVMEYDGKPVGVIGLLNLSGGRAEYYVTLGEAACRGRGIARRATQQLLAQAFSEMGLEEVYLYTEVENTAAQKLFERCGFQKRSLEKNSAQNRGKPVDRYYYTIDKNTWISEESRP